MRRRGHRLPSPQLPQEAVDAAGQVVGPRVSAVGRTGGDGTLGQVLGLGTAGVTHGAVTTVEFADSHGMHGGATAVTQNLGVATVPAGMASSPVNVAAGASGHNPSAANSGSSAEGVETPSPQSANFSPASRKEAASCKMWVRCFFVQWRQCAAARCHGAEGPFALRISRQTSEH